MTVWNGIDLLCVEAPCTVFFADKCTAWLVGNQYSAVYIPFHLKVSGYEGIISDILRVCWFLISLPFSSTEMLLECTIHLLCWRMVYSGIRTYNCLPAGIKDLSTNFESFKSAQKKLLLENSFYTSQEYFSWAASK